LKKSKNNKVIWWEIWGFIYGERSTRGLQRCDAV